MNGDARAHKTEHTAAHCVIDAEHLYKCYPGFPPVLRGINIQVMTGEMVAIMGPSGCGKSTMLHVLGMLHAPDNGSLKVLGTDVLALQREEIAAFRRGNMGFVMQSSNLFEHSTVFENVEFPLIYENVPPEERWERVIRALELVRLSHRVSYRSNRLSGGEQQRVAIARAMVNNPRILLADEPTGALDAKTSKVVMENFCSLAHEGGIAMVIVTHDPGVAEYCDSVYTLEEGLLVCQRKSAVSLVSGGGGLLQAKERLCHGICVVDEFPTPYGTAAVQHTLSLYEQRLLTRVYSVRGAPLSHMIGADYSLPVLMKRQGMWKTLWSMLLLWRTKQNNPGILWRYWKSLPVGARLNIFTGMRYLWYFAKGARMVPWCFVDMELGRGGVDKRPHIHGLSAGTATTAIRATTAAWVAGGILGIPFSFTVRAQDLHKISVVCAKALHAAFVCCDSKVTQEHLREACLKKDPHFDITKIHHLYEPSALLPHTDDLPLDEHAHTSMPSSGAWEAFQGHVNILVAGHITKQKNVIHVIKACALLLKKDMPIRLSIVGSGSALSSLRRYCFFHGLRKMVHFLGAVPHEHMPELYRKAHIFVDASDGEERGGGGIATSLMEAMLFGLPVAVRRTVWHEEILEHETSALFYGRTDVRGNVRENIRELSAILERMARFPDMARDLGKVAQRFALEKFSQEKQARRLAELILGKNDA